MIRPIAVRRIPAADLFVTPEFRESPWVRDIVEKVKHVWVTEDVMPPGHFGTYFGALTRRTYENKHVQDLYHLHECVHVRETKYRPSDSWPDWTRKMIRAEFEASIASECTAYLEITGLRPKTFAHGIWVDRFLNGPLRDSPQERQNRIREERIRALNAPRYDDFFEQQIHNYRTQNFQWCKIWAQDVGYGPHESVPAFRIVEAHMAASDRDATHERWLLEVSELDRRRELTPFMRQAEAFAPIYKKNGEEFGNHWLLR